MNVFLCEKPAQAKTLAQHIGATRFVEGAWQGNGAAVVAAQGHLLGLAPIDEYVGKGKWKLDDLPVLPQSWVLQVKEDERSKELFAAIGRFLAQADQVILATDPDDEGELLGRDLLNAHGYKGKVSRLWVSALNSDGLSDGLSNLLPLSATDGFYRAANVRRKLDWMFGMNLSRAFSVVLGKTTHVGRIKTKLLTELVQRERQIAAFKPNPYHSVTAKMLGGAEEYHFFSGSAPTLLDQDALDDMLNLKGASGTLTSVIEDNVEVAPPLPYSLSALLADAALSGIGLSDGYSATQALYLAGAISYPRSGSTSMPGTNSGDFAAHSAIHVTGDLPAGATEAMTSIYNLVKQNLQMQSMRAATINRRTVVVDVEGKLFKLHEQTLMKEGFTGLIQPWHPDFAKYRSMVKKGAIRKLYKKGSEMIVTGMEVKRLETIAPAPFNEASMLKMMLENGIGTEATRVSSINSLLRDGVATSGVAGRGPVVLRPTDWAQDVVANLPSSVLGNNMTGMVKAAQEAARHSGGNLDSHLLEANKWMVGVIPESESVAS